LPRWKPRSEKKTGINTLKIGFNNIFGYYIEVTKANAALVPDSYIRNKRWLTRNVILIRN